VFCIKSKAGWALRCGKDFRSSNGYTSYPGTRLGKSTGFTFHPFSRKGNQSRKLFCSSTLILYRHCVFPQSQRTGTPLKAKQFCSESFLVLGLTILAPCSGFGAAPQGQCSRVVLEGQVDAGHTWSKPFGHGWVFRLLPIKAGEHGYSGWDLAVDRSGGIGFPDALLLATPPYDSINQREVGTTFGIRAQDAIGWNPRSFHFLTNPSELRKAQKLYFILRGKPDTNKRDRELTRQVDETKRAEEQRAVSKSLMDIATHASTGQFRIVDASLTPGTANALPYAQNWALQQRNTPHTITTTTSPTPYGKLDAIRFEITLWLPAGWKAPKTLQSAPAPCQ
jgi:hypothetical protein